MVVDNKRGKITIPRSLTNDIKTKDCILFIGDEVSAEAGITDRWLAQRLIEKNIDAPKKAPQEYELPEAAEECKVATGTQAMIQDVIEFIRERSSRPELSHYLIRLIHYFDNIVTTNLDDLVEKALGVDPIITNKDLGFFKIAKRHVLKLRGSVTRPDSIQITLDDLHDILGDKDRQEQMTNLIWNEIQGWANKKTLLFVGCDMESPILKKILNFREGSEPSSKRIAYVFSSNISETRKTQLLGDNVVSAEARPKDFFRTLIEKLPEVDHETGINRQSEMALQTERISEIKTSPRKRTRPPVVGYYGFPGIGKSTLMDKIETQWKCENIAHVRFVFGEKEMFSVKNLQRDLLKQSKIPENKLNNMSEEELKATFEHTLDTKPAVLLLDSIDRASEKTRDQIETFLKDSLEFLRKRKLYVVITASTKQKADPWLDARENLSIFVPIKPFDLSSTSDLIMQLTESYAPDDAHKEIHELTRGYPAGIKAVVNKLKKLGEVHTDDGCIEENAVKNHKGPLLKVLKKEIINNIFGRLSNQSEAEDAARLCEILSPLPLPFNLGVSSRINTKVIEEKFNPSAIMTLFGKMQNISVLEKGTGGEYAINDCLQGFFSEYISYNHPETYKKIIEEAHEYYLHEFNNRQQLAFDAYAVIVCSWLLIKDRPDAETTRWKDDTIDLLKNQYDKPTKEREDVTSQLLELNEFLKEDKFLKEQARDEIKDVLKSLLPKEDKR